MKIEIVDHTMFVEHDGIRDTCEGWAKRIGLKVATFQSRIRRVKSGVWTEDQLFHRGTMEWKDRIDANAIEHDGKTLTVAEWSRICGINQKTMGYRVKRFRAGMMSEEECFRIGSIPSKKKMVTYGGKQYTIDGIARKFDLPITTVRSRMALIRRGEMAPERLFVKGKIPGCDRIVMKSKRYTTEDGTRVSIQDVARKANVSIDSIQRRMRNGMTIADLWSWAEDPFRRVKGQCFFRGRKEPINEALKEVGIDNKVVNGRIALGWSIEEAVSEGKVTKREAAERARLSRVKNDRIRELKRMGVAV